MVNVDCLIPRPVSFARLRVRYWHFFSIQGAGLKRKKTLLHSTSARIQSGLEPRFLQPSSTLWQLPNDTFLWLHYKELKLIPSRKLKRQWQLRLGHLDTMNLSWPFCSASLLHFQVLIRWILPHRRELQCSVARAEGWRWRVRTLFFANTCRLRRPQNPHQKSDIFGSGEKVRDGTQQIF